MKSYQNIMHRKALYLSVFFILTFSSSITCIRNKKENDTEMLRGKAVIAVAFFPDKEIQIKARSLSFEDRSSPNVVRFPQDFYQSSENNRNNLNSREISDLDQSMRTKYIENRPRQTSFNNFFNTQEYVPSQSQSQKYRLVQSNPDVIYGSQPSSYKRYPPNGFGQNYNYQAYQQYPQRKDYPPPDNGFNQYPQTAYPPQRPLPSFSPHPYPYRYEDGSGQPGGQGIFSNNPLMNFISNFVPQGSHVANFKSKFVGALEDIARNDDLQCVPKLLCEMVGDPERRAKLPGFISSPSVTALIAALPSTSPALTFGRAALLGFTGGLNSCDYTYPKCPREEEDLLYYLNNHRGGFFKFFNGGTTFGDEVDYNDQPGYDQNYQTQSDFQTNQEQQQQQQQIPSNIDLQSLTGLLGSMGGGLNLANLGLLSNLASLFTQGGKAVPQKAAPTKSSQSGISGLVGNLLTGLVGNYFTSRKLQRRNSLEIDQDFHEENAQPNLKRIRKRSVNNISDSSSKIKEVKSKPKKNSEVTTENSTIPDAHSSPKNASASSSETGDDPENQAEGRIVNRKKIFAEYNDFVDNKFSFPKESANLIETPREGKKIKFEDDAKQTYEPYIRYPPYAEDDLFIPYPESSRRGKRIVFQSSTNYAPDFSQGSFVTDFKQATPYGENSYSTQMIFPDRTGTGNLRFDNDKFYNADRVHQNKIQYATYETTTHRPYYGKYDEYTTPRRPVYQYVTRRPSNSQKAYPAYSTSAYRYPPRNDNPNIYVTNSKGVVEYFITPRGEKIYI